MSRLLVGFSKAPPSVELGKIHRKFKTRQKDKLALVNGYSVEIPEEKLDEYLRALPKDARVMWNQDLFDKRCPAVPVSKSDIENPYVSRAIGMEEVHSQGLTGQGKTICVVDSGLQAKSDFEDRIKFFKDFSRRGKRKPFDSHGHGTQVAGVAVGNGEQVKGVAPEAELVALRIETPQQAIKAIEWAIENKEKYSIDVLNLSLGVPDRITGRQDPFAQATQKAIDAGIITIVAAGNEGADCPLGGGCPGTISSPGILEDAITVGAYDDAQTESLEDDKLWSGTSFGPTRTDKLAKPDIVAPGFKVAAPEAEGSFLGENLPNWGPGYDYNLGTSLAAPMVAGAAAIMLQQNPSLTQKDIKSALMQSAIPLQNASSLGQGAGRLNLSSLIDRTSPDSL